MIVRASFTIWLACIAAVFTTSGNAQLESNLAQQPPANAWMKTVSPDIQGPERGRDQFRLERDDFWDSLPTVSRVPLTSTIALGTSVSEGSYGLNSPEIGHFPNRQIVIATFGNYKSYLTPSRHDLYTDVDFRVGEVVEGSNVSAGDTITVSIRGGTVLTASGDLISYLTEPRQYFIQPARTYLLVLIPHPSGNFFLLGGNWDVSDGTVRPNSYRDQSLFKEGRSLIDGKSQADATSILRRKQLTGKR